MITPKNIHPERSLYAIGGSILSVIKNIDEVEIDPEVIYKEFSSIYPLRISYSYFVYSLDWLFLAGLIELRENKIKKCF
jgi:hypothetical protein